MSQSLSSPFRAAMKTRRTYYKLSPKSNIPDSKIIEIVKEAVLHVPSSFNSQSTRVVMLIGAEHKKLWGEIAKDVLKAVVPLEQWPSTEQKLTGFEKAYGTVLFYEDPKPVADLQEKFPLYADKFPQWSEHTSAMHQYASKYQTPSLLRRQGLTINKSLDGFCTRRSRCQFAALQSAY